MRGDLQLQYCKQEGTPVLIRTSQDVFTWAVLTTGCSSFNDFRGSLTLLILTSAVEVRENESGLEMVPVRDEILGCETHGEKVASFPLAGLALWHTERTRFVILASFFRFVSLSFPPLPSTHWNCGVKVYHPKGPGSVLVPNPTITLTPPELICKLGFPRPATPLIDDSVLRKIYHQINVFWKYL